MIDLRPDHLALVKQILAQIVPDCEVRAFGSRVRGTAKNHSDLDLALVAGGSIEPQRLNRLQEAFEESDLPFRVDVLDRGSVSEAFRQLIDRQFDVLQAAHLVHPPP
jgi:type I restriction enzyme S subunit